MIPGSAPFQADSFPGRPNEPFFWGRGGRRMTPEEIALAKQRGGAAVDTSPLGHWTQGVARVLNAGLDGLELRRAEKAEAANMDAAAQIRALLTPGADAQTLIAAASDPYLDEGTRSVAGELLKAQIEAQNRKPPAPHYWETNNGSLGMVGADGKPIILYEDPTPKVDWIQIDNGDGTKTLTPVVNGQMGGAAPAGGPPATLPPDFDFGDEGGPASAPGGFPR